MSRIQALKNLINAEKQLIIKSNIVSSFMKSLGLKSEAFEMSCNQRFDLHKAINDFNGINRKVVFDTLIEKMLQLVDKDNTIRSLMKCEMTA